MVIVCSLLLMTDKTFFIVNSLLSRTIRMEHSVRRFASANILRKITAPTRFSAARILR